MLHVCIQLILVVITGDAIKVFADLRIMNAAISCLKHSKYLLSYGFCSTDLIIAHAKGAWPLHRDNVLLQARSIATENTRILQTSPILRGLSCPSASDLPVLHRCSGALGDP